MERQRFYRLDGHAVLPVVGDSFVQHVAAMIELGFEGMCVGRTEINEDLFVSTMFLGLDHAQEGPPLVFETALLFGDGDMRTVLRYSTWEQASAGHDLTVAVCKATLSKAGVLHDEDVPPRP